MAPFDRSHTSSYSAFIVTMGYFVSFARSRNFYTKPVFSGLAGGDPVEIL